MRLLPEVFMDHPERPGVSEDGTEYTASLLWLKDVLVHLLSVLKQRIQERSQAVEAH